MMWDIGHESFQKGEIKATDPDHLTKTGLTSHLLAIRGFLVARRFSSVLALPTSICILNDMALKASTWKEYSKAAKWFFR